MDEIPEVSLRGFFCRMSCVVLFLVLIYISTLENHRKGWSREIPEPVFSIYLTFLPCIPLNHNPLPRHKRTIRFLRFKFSINH